MVSVVLELDMRISRKQFGASVPSMAMGDIAFLLLIFFVILAKVDDDSHLKLTLAADQNLVTGKLKRASVAIDEDNKIYLNGQPINSAGLSGALSNILGDSGKGKRTVYLKTHRDAPAQFYEPVIEAIAQAGGELHIVAYEER